MDQKPEDSSTPPSQPESEPTQAPEPAPASEPKSASEPTPAPEPTASEPTPASAPAPAPEPAPAPAEETTQTSETGISKDSLNMGMLCHLLALTGLITAGAGNILGPLIIWLMKKENDPYVDEQGKESLNFQISMLIYGFVCGLLLMVVIGFILLPILALAWLVLTIIGTIKASKGEPWKYPITIRLIK